MTELLAKLPPSTALLGALLAIVAWLSSPQVLALMSPAVASVVGAVGALVYAIGNHAAHQTTQALVENITPPDSLAPAARAPLPSSLQRK